jgi:hypothetical protein
MFSVPLFLIGLVAFGPVVQCQQQKVFDDLLPFGERLDGLDLKFEVARNGCKSAVGSDLFGC